LIHHSKYFKAAPEGSFNEAATNKVEIEDGLSDDIFRAFVYWIYKQEVATRFWEDVDSDVECQRLIELYALGDRLDFETSRLMPSIHSTRPSTNYLNPLSF